MYVNPLAINVSQPAAGSPMHSDKEPLLIPGAPKEPQAVVWYNASSSSCLCLHNRMLLSRDAADSSAQCALNHNP